MKFRLDTPTAMQNRRVLSDALKEGPLTLEQMAELLDMSEVQAQKYKALLHGEHGDPKLIYIEKWIRVKAAKQSRWVAAYRWMVTGREVDAPKPPAMTRAERNAARHAKIEQYAVTGIPVDPLLNAFFGMKTA